ncbi:MAG: DUF4199 domain-containing protein [Paludibacter sp.]|nr:DUF4199 domain-containing protein [Paludibacter sp.]
MQRNITKSALHNFHFVGLLLSLKFILSAQKNGAIASLSLFVSISIIFVLYRMAIHFRETEYGGIMKYGQVFRYVFLIYFFASIVSSIVIFIYTNFIDKFFLDLTLDALMKMYDGFKYPIDDKTYEAFQAIYKPLPYASLNVFMSIISGGFWGLILAGFIKKEKSIFEE